jgi:hypothetical protein
VPQAISGAIAAARSRPSAVSSRELAADDDAVGFEVAEALSEELSADARQPLDQVGEPPWPGRELADDQQRPPVAGYIERAGECAVLLVAVVRHAVPLLN